MDFERNRIELEKSIANIGLDDPWRGQLEHSQQQPWGSAAGGMAAGGQASGAGGQQWGHMSPQMPANVNDALGINPTASGAGASWGNPAGGGPAEYDQTARIWSDQHPTDAQPGQPHFAAMHHGRGMMDPNAAGGGDWMAGPGQQQQQQLWSEPMKQEQDGFWKHQPQGWPTPQAMPGWPPRQVHPNQPPPQHQQPRGAPMMHRGGWQPNGMVPGQAGGKPQGMGGWDGGQGVGPQGHRPYPQMAVPRGGMPQQPRGPNRGGGGGGGGYPPQIDMSIPPPVDAMGQPMNMRQGPPSSHMWKPENMGGAPNGMRAAAPYQPGMVPPFVPSNKQMTPQAPGGFTIAPAEDMIWHDPNGDLKKWQRDTGVSAWGDPDKYNERPVRLWIVPEGQDEDLEAALMKCPVPQKKNDDGTTRLPFPIPSKRSIIPTGWGELPENDPNNPSKSGSAKWAEMGGHVPGVASAPSSMPAGSAAGVGPSPSSSDMPWYLPQQGMGSHPNEHQQGMGGWPQSDPTGQAQQQSDPNTMGSNAQMLADQLKYASEKGYLDISYLNLSHPLPAPVCALINTLLSKIPLLESAQAELKQLIDSVRPEGETGDHSPQRWMNDVQKVEYNRLIIEVTTAKIEVSEQSKKIQRALVEAGLAPTANTASDSVGVGSSQDYHYSFLE
ncbi:hypothetical protein WR25_11720 [Diploscapter pachys]|uniref:Uncharacterized protein n=1 Tax=Diploscapter pachys TaxID=2018661 RepID=A0A2A2KPN0_9BILA|nr:hypothetical protein WR25_11720 [Diploscapter pachys]